MAPRSRASHRAPLATRAIRRRSAGAKRPCDQPRCSKKSTGSRRLREARAVPADRDHSGWLEVGTPRTTDHLDRTGAGLNRAEYEKPRHVFREAGLIISSDLCPVTPGSSTRLSTSLQIITCDRLGQSVLRLLRARLSKPCPRWMARAEDIVRWCHGSSARC